MGEMKRCEVCGKVLPLSEFCAIKGKILDICKDCVLRRRKKIKEARKVFLADMKESVTELREQINKKL